MRNYFSHNNDKERRLLWFAGPDTSDPQSETEGAKPDEGKEKKDSAAEKVGEGETGEQVDKASRDAAEGAAEDAQKDAEAAKEKALSDANKTFTSALEVGETPENALAAINGDTETFKLNADNTGVEYNEAPDEQLVSDETRESIVEAFKQAAALFREIMDAITEGLKGVAGDTGVTGETGEQDPGGKNTEEDPGGKNTEEDPGGKKGEKGPEGAPDGLNNEAKQNPREAIASLDAEEVKLEAELAELGGGEGGVEKDETGRMREILDRIEEIHTQKEQLEGLITDRKDAVDALWKKAEDASGLEDAGRAITDITCEDGNTLVATITEGTDPAALAQLEAAGFTKGENNTYTMLIPDHRIFDQIDKFGPAFDKYAAIPSKPKDEPENEGDLSGSAEDKEASPETLKMVAELNEQLKKLVEENGEFMEETPIGKIFSKMEYKAVGNEIMLNIPAEAAGQLRDIMKANGRSVTEKEGGGYTIEGYPDGTTVDMPATGAADYPSRLAWGGTDGDPKSQFARAESGMNQWSNIVSKTPPEGTEPVEAEDNLDTELSEDLSEGGAKVKAALDALKGRLGDAVDESTFGQFVNSLTVKSVGDNIALVSNADAATFSHIHNQMGIKSLLAEPLTTHGGDGYVMQLEEGRADNLVYNLERWAAMMGSTPEGGKGGDLGPEVGKNEKPKEDEGPKEDPEQIKKDYEKALAAMKSGVENLKFHVQSESGGVDALNDDGSVNPGSTLESILKDIDGLVNNPDLKIPDGRNLGSDLATMLDASDLFDKFDAGDAEYQIFMDENGIGVERIKPEKEEPADEA